MDRRQFIAGTLAGLAATPSMAGSGLLSGAAGPLIDMSSGFSLYEKHDLEPEPVAAPRARPAEIELPTGNPTLSMYNVHTEETLRVQPVSATGFDHDSLARVNRFMRDWRRNEVAQIDPNAILGLLQIQQRARQNGFSGNVRFLSGYRSQATNDALRASGVNAARNSLHIQAKAIDFSLPGVGIPQTILLAKDLDIGGVGGYSSFVHIDTGRVRFWGTAV